MFDRVNQDAWKIRKMMREAEALGDEMLISLSALKGEMLKARQNPAVEVHTGQEALLHLTEAEQLVTRASNRLLRTHNALSDLARETAGVDENIPTERVPSRRTEATQPRFTSTDRQVETSDP